MSKPTAVSKFLNERVDELFRQALELHQKGHLVQARELYEEILKPTPGHADALHLLGVIAYQTQNHQRALDLIDQAVRSFPDNAAYYSNRGLVLHALGKYEAAIGSCDQALAIRPAYAEAWFNRGNSLQSFGKFDAAIASYDQSLAINPAYAEAWSNRGFVLREMKKTEQAIESYDRAISIIPSYAEAWSNRGTALIDLKQYEAAIESYNRAIAIRPDYAEAWSNRGNAQQEFKQYEAALASYDRAIAIRPDYAEAFYNRGNALGNLMQFESALSSYDKAIAIRSTYAEAWLSRGNALKALKQPEAAIASYDRAIELDHEYARAFYNRGNVFLELRQYDAAIESYDHAIGLDPDYAEAHANRGVALHELSQPKAALLSYAKAISLKPDYAEVYANRGNVLSDLKEFDAASADYEKALSIDADGDYWLGEYRHLKMMTCDWNACDSLSNQVAAKIGNYKRASTPFPVLAMTSSLSLIKRAASIYVEDKYPMRSTAQENLKRSKHDKIRVGYYSADFHDHATMYLMAELFEKHDRSKFELLAFSFGPDRQEDVMRKRVVPAFDQFIDVRAKSDKEIALLSRELEVDIAVDLKGFTENARTDIFSYRAAPIQVNYLGYPGTMGAEYMEYIIADPTLVPRHSRQFYTEKIVYLPDSYQVNDAKRQIAEKVFSRKELGLPTTGFVFCCFNNNYKITPDIFDCWLRILENVDGSVLWLLEDNPKASGNLRREASRRGVDDERLVFCSRIPFPEHQARQRSADLFLDTMPYNAHTTASDALWAGLPVLTCSGESFAGRVAASLLNAIELPELITSSLEKYKALAIELATNPEKLNGIKLKLENNRLTAPLFDSDRFTRHIEAAYGEMYKRYQLDLPAEHIDIKPDDQVIQK